jgi:hypothetical protein
MVAAGILAPEIGATLIVKYFITDVCHPLGCTPALGLVVYFTYYASEDRLGLTGSGSERDLA